MTTNELELAESVQRLCRHIAYDDGCNPARQSDDPVMLEAVRQHDRHVDVMINLMMSTLRLLHGSPAGHAFVHGGRLMAHAAAGLDGDDALDWEELLCARCDLPRSAHEVGAPAAESGTAIAELDSVEALADASMKRLYGPADRTASLNIDVTREMLKRDVSVPELRALSRYLRTVANEVTRAAGERALGDAS